MNFCGEFSDSNTNGAVGFFAMSIGLSEARYFYNLDLIYLVQRKTTLCDLSEGISYYIASAWQNQMKSSSSGSTCGSYFTGG